MSKIVRNKVRKDHTPAKAAQAAKTAQRWAAPLVVAFGRNQAISVAEGHPRTDGPMAMPWCPELAGATPAQLAALTAAEHEARAELAVGGPAGYPAESCSEVGAAGPDFWSDCESRAQVKPEPTQAQLADEARLIVNTVRLASDGWALLQEWEPTHEAAWHLACADGIRLEGSVGRMVIGHFSIGIGRKGNLFNAKVTEAIRAEGLGQRQHLTPAELVAKKLARFEADNLRELRGELAAYNADFARLCELDEAESDSGRDLATEAEAIDVADIVDAFVAVADNHPDWAAIAASIGLHHTDAVRMVNNWLGTKMLDWSFTLQSGGHKWLGLTCSDKARWAETADKAADRQLMAECRKAHAEDLKVLRSLCGDHFEQLEADYDGWCPLSAALKAELEDRRVNEARVALASKAADAKAKKAAKAKLPGLENLFEGLGYDEVLKSRKAPVRYVARPAPAPQLVKLPEPGRVAIATMADLEADQLLAGEDLWARRKRHDIRA